MAVAKYYFDGSDASATDPNGVWTNDANAFDGSITTFATISSGSEGSASLNYLKAEGTNAPSGSGTISSVSVRAYIDVFCDFQANIYTDSEAENLGTATFTGSVSNPVWGSSTVLSTPSGGWTWAKIQSLEIRIWLTSTLAVGGIARIELDVIYDPFRGSANTAWLRA